ncbi:MAG: hypothetical protein NXI19_15450 [Alphaproteobacteria bacterium]|nr:hypothetical protein [Alphaproteobacteria bacterium]
MPIPQSILNIEQREALDPAGLEQSALTRIHFAPIWREIQQDLEVLRREADAAILSQIGQSGGLRSGRHGGYPHGYCKPIRDFTLQRLLTPTSADIGRPACAAITRFREAGGLVKGIWGVQKDRYFQNAIQVGDLWFDLANDTVDTTRPPVEILPFAEAQFSEIKSFERYATIAESYWGLTAVPNRYLRGLAASFPVLLYGPTGPVRVAAPVTMTPRNIRLAYLPARSFLLDGPFADRTLPDRIAETLMTTAGGNADPMTPSELDQALTAECDAAANLTESAFLDRFSALLQNANRFMTPEQRGIASAGSKELETPSSRPYL